MERDLKRSILSIKKVSIEEKRNSETSIEFDCNDFANCLLLKSDNAKIFKHIRNIIYMLKTYNDYEND